MKPKTCLRRPSRFDLRIPMRIATSHN